MATNKDFFNSLKTNVVNYLLCDLHVHSIASADILEQGRYSELDESEKQLIDSLEIQKEDYLNKWGEYDQLVSDRIEPDKYLELIENRRNEIAAIHSLSDGKDWSVIAITDHNTCKFACKVSASAWGRKDASRIIVLPGIELEVQFKIEDEDVAIHVCIIYAPCTEASQVHTAINRAYYKSNNTEETGWNFGDPIKVQRIDEFIKSLRTNPSFPALCIAAHVGSTKGIRQAAVEAFQGNQEFTRTQAEYARLSAELEEVDSKEGNEIRKDVENKLNQLQSSLEQSSFKTLRIIGKCGFDALQVSNKKDDFHYRSLHRFKEESGRAVTILCSDAHSIKDIFDCGNDFVSYIKFPEFNSRTNETEFFDHLKVSLRFGETRFTSVPKSQVNCFIRGIEISPETKDAKQFWPFVDNKIVIPFSPNLNCLIGGRGSGKSALIEAISFLFDIKGAFNIQAAKSPKNQEEWYRRAKATLAGCKIKICWVSYKENFQSLKKKSLFVDRFFSDDSDSSSDYRTIEGEEVTDDNLKMDCAIQLFRMGDLEKKAVDYKDMRALFDDICGPEIKSLGREIDDLIGNLKSQRESIADVFRDLAELTKENSPLRKYVVRKKHYDDANTKEMQEKFDKLDVATKAKQIADAIKGSWDSLSLNNQVDQLKEGVESFFNEVDSQTKDNDDSVIKDTEIIREKLLKEDPDGLSVKNKILDNITNLEGSIEGASTIVESVNTNISKEAKAQRDSLEKSGSPAGSKDRDNKKRLFDESEQALSEYTKLLEKLKILYKDRMTLFKELERRARKRTELRQDTANGITDKLSKNLNRSVLVIEADAQPMADKQDFVNWLENFMFPQGTHYKEKRIIALLEKGLVPTNFRKLLIGSENEQNLIVDEMSAKEGKIDETLAKCMLKHAKVCYKWDYDAEIEENQINKDDLPEVIQKGIRIFIEDSEKVDAFLQLDEILFDDIPEIRLKDRPGEMEKARPITELSPGQRCSAVLPIILLNGECPLARVSYL